MVATSVDDSLAPEWNAEEMDERIENPFNPLVLTDPPATIE